MDIKIAYFSAEIGIDSRFKTYSGGLGILAGDTLKSMADLEVPICAITLLYKEGYFKQIISKQLRQQEEVDTWDYKNFLKDTKKKVKVNILGENILIKIWSFDYKGITGHIVPIFFLDTHLEENPQWAKELTNKLYVGDRIAQEMILGIGGLRALDELGFDKIQKYHMNEGHSAFLTLELYKKLGEKNGWDDWQVKERCIFTTHTPVPAGHDKFSYEKIYEHFKGEIGLIPWHIKEIAGKDELNMTKLAFSFSTYHNAVSKIHAKITKEMFKNFTVDYITNGVHLPTWVCCDFANLYDEYIPGWREDNSKLKSIFRVPNSVIYTTHLAAKSKMIDAINKNNVTNVVLKKEILTIGFARRFVPYKDAELIFKNLDLLKELGGKIQFVFSGKSHMNDSLGKDILHRILENSVMLKDNISIAFVENYNMEISKLLVSGCDLWLNTPIPFNEASGTSGMKACANGCLHFSRLDGWAIEGFERNGGGFPIAEYEDFIMNLKYKLLPRYYNNNKISWIEEMKLAIGNSASYFNTYRMAKEYLEKAYKLK